MKTTNAPAVEWPPSGASSSTRTASQGKASTDFGALLDTHQARTATAEGPKKHKSPEKTEARQAKPAEKPDAPVQEQPEPKPVDAPRPEAKPADGCDQQPTEGQQPQGDQPTVETPAVVNEPVVEFVPAPVIAEVAKPQTGEQAAAIATQAAAQQQQQAAGEPVAIEAPVAAPQQQQQLQQPTGETAEAAVPVAAQATEAKPPPQQQQLQADVPVVADEQSADAAPEPTVTRADKPAQPQGQQAQTQQQPQQQAGDQPRQQPGGEQRLAEGPRASTQEQPVQQRVATAAEPRAERNQAQPVQTGANPNVTNVPAPSVSPLNSTRTDNPTRAVPLSKAADAVENVIRLGSQRGVTHARLSLKPADLGGVEIRLQQTSTGLTASVVADGVEAAQMLQQAGAELRQKLEAQGIHLQSLDISYSGDEQRDARSAAAETGDGERRSSTGDSSTATDGGELTPTEEISVEETLELPDGVLVDVLA